MSNTNMKFIQFFSCGQKYDLMKWLKLKREAVGFPIIYHLVAKEFTKVAVPYFFHYVHCLAV